MEAKKQNIIIIVLAVLIVALIVLLAVFRIPQRSVAKLSSISDQKKVNVYEEKIDIDGLEKPFTIFFVADAHLCLCDERDEECMDYCESRYVDFMRDSMGSEENFSLVMDYVKRQNPDLVIFGGDIVDEAIRSAEKKTISHFFDVVLNKRYDEEDMIILTEKDFERADHK